MKIKTYKVCLPSFGVWPAHFTLNTHTHTHAGTRTHTCTHTCTHWHLGGKCAVRRLRVPLVITTLHLNNLHPSSSTLTSALSLSLKSLSLYSPPPPPSLYLSLLFPPSPPFFLPACFSSSCFYSLHPLSSLLSLIWLSLICRPRVDLFSFQPSLKSIFNDDVISAFMCNLAGVSMNETLSALWRQAFISC